MDRKVARKLASRILAALPFGLGKKLWFPGLRRRLPFLFFSREKRLQEEKKAGDVRAELERIRTAMPGDCAPAHVIMVYDNSVSPPTYGDFLLVLMLARYFSILGSRVDFYIVDSEYRNDWDNLSEAQRQKLVAGQVEMARALLHHSPGVVQRAGWEEINLTLSGAPPSSFKVFEERMRSRASIYDAAFNVLNHLAAAAPPEVRSRLVLTFEELGPAVGLERPSRSYVAYHCRYSDKWDAMRNTTASEFLKVHARLSASHPGCEILIVSDEEGCDHFRALAGRHGLQCLYSKDFTKTFLEDAVLMTGSEFYFQQRGGGMGVVALCSGVPFEISTPVTNDIMWSTRKATSWQSDRQKFERLR